MNLEAFFSSPFHARLVLTLGHFLWQAAAIAVLAWVAIVLLRRSSSQLRYGVLAAALVAMAACPPVTFCFLRTSAEAVAEPLPPERGPGAEQAFVTTPAPIVSGSSDRAGPARGDQTVPSAPPRSAGTLAEAPSKPEAPAAAGKRSWKDLAAYLTAVYVLGVAVMLGRLLLGLSGGRKLRRLSEPVEDPTLLSIVAGKVKSVGLGFTPALAYCRQVAFPTVVGVLRPTILLPLSLASGLSADELGALLAHELAHIRRYDHIFNLFQRIIEALLFFHPGVWLISRQIRLEREKCCDDLVVAAGGEPLSYASSLVRMAEICLRGRQARRHLPSAALAAGDKPSQLRSRVARLIGAGAHERLRLPRTGALAIVLMAAALVGASLFVNVKAEPVAKKEEASPATQPAERAAGYAERLARSFALLVAKQKLGFLAEKDAHLLESEMSAFLRGVAPREPSAELQAALSASLERYVPAYFTNDDETYLALRDRVNTLKVKLWWALSAGKLTPGQAKRREFQRLWMHEYIDSVPENPTALAANRLGPGGLRAMAHDQLQRFLEDPLSPLYYVMTSQQFQALQDRVKGRWEKLLSQPGQPFDRPDRVPFSCLSEAWRVRLPCHNDPKDPSKVVFEVILPFQDRIEGWNISQGLNLRFASNAAFRGSQVQLDTMRTGGLPRNAVNVVTGKWLNYPQALQRTAIHSPERMRYMKRHGGMDLVLNVQPAALVGLRGARLARLEVPGWQWADGVSDAALAELIQRDGAESVSVARFPLWPYGAKQPAPMFLALRTGQGRLGVVRIVYRHQHPNDPTDGTVCIHYRLRRTEAVPGLTIPKPAPTGASAKGASTTRASSPQAQPGAEESKEALEARIAKLIARLGSEDHKQREEAERALVRIGIPALEALKEAVSDKDPERAHRAKLALRTIVPNTVRISVQEPVEVDMPVWVDVKIDNALLAANLRYPFNRVPWFLQRYVFEVRRDGEALPMRPINPGVGMMAGSGSVAPPGSPAGRLPLHLLYRFSKPGKYEVRLLVYRHLGSPYRPESDGLMAVSDWLELTVQPLAENARKEWLKKMTAAPPKDIGRIVGDYLPSLLACPDETVAGILEDLLHHDSELVQGYALHSLWGYYDDKRLRKDIPAILKKKGPTSLLAHFIAWRRDLFFDSAPELVDICIESLKSESAATVQGGLEGLLFLKSHYDWGKRPEVPARIDQAVLTAAEGITRRPETAPRHALSVYLGSIKTATSRKLLWKLTEDNDTREQSVIALCWIADPADLPALSRILLKGGSSAARCLPYHLHRGYGTDSLPHLKKAAEESPDQLVRKKCQSILQMGKKTSTTMPRPAPTGASSKGASTARQGSPQAQPATATAPAGKVQRLTLEGAQVTNESLEKLKGLRLESLMLYKAAVTDEGLARLAGVGSLKKLYLRTMPGIKGPGLVHLQAIRGLESLELWGTSVDEKSLVHLVGVQGLRELSLPYLPLTEAGLARLGRMTNLRRLNLYGCPVTDAGLAKLEPLRHLEGLDLTHTRVTDAGLERLKAFRNLKALSVGSGRDGRGAISDAGVAHLAALANLEELHLVGRTAITDKGVKHLAGLKRLRSLSLVGTNASGHALKEVKDLPELERLMLSGSQAAAGIEHLAAMKKLSSVWIVGQFGGEFDMEWMQRLRGVLPPGCRIGWSD